MRDRYFSRVSVRLLPLFPLPLVLFPGTPLPLHIFEPRYRQLLADCLDSDSRFGILFRAEDMAEHELPPGHVGCIAEIENTQPLPDGRSNVLVQGVERFALQRFVVTPAPYHVGEIVSYDDEPESRALLDPLANDVRSLFERVGHAARALADDADPLPELPGDPSALAFGIAALVDIDPAGRQRLLESRSPTDRLRQVAQVLGAAVDPLEDRARVHTRAKSNGHGPHAESEP
jgi:Lon protease-like protein